MAGKPLPLLQRAPPCVLPGSGPPCLCRRAARGPAGRSGAGPEWRRQSRRGTTGRCLGCLRRVEAQGRPVRHTAWTTGCETGRASSLPMPESRSPQARDSSQGGDQARKMGRRQGRRTHNPTARLGRRHPATPCGSGGVGARQGERSCVAGCYKQKFTQATLTLG